MFNTKKQSNFQSNKNNTWLILVKEKTTKVTLKLDLQSKLKIKESVLYLHL